MEIKRLILQLLHGLISLASFMFSSLKKLTKNDVFGSTDSNAGVNFNDTVFGRVKRLPVHIGLIFVEDISYTDVANIMLWCIAIGVSYITIYDPNGDIKRKCKLLENLIHQRTGEINKNNVYDIRIHTGCVDTAGRSKSAHCNRWVDVVLLSRDDGIGQLVDTTQQLCRSVSHKTQLIDDILPSTVDSILQEHHGFPDPELVIKFGRTASLLGYLPWQSRLSEIISVPSHHSYRPCQLVDALHRYSCTQKRCGK